MTNSIAGKIYSDDNFNGVQDSQELGLNGVQVQLLDSSGNIVGIDTTYTDGSYEFSNLAPGPYVVRQVGQSGFVQTSPTFATQTIEIPVDTTGHFQSGVNFDNIPPTDFNEILKTSYDGGAATEIINKGTNFEVKFEPGNNNFVDVNGEKFELVNIHFHSESEHAEDGELSDLEMHVVHGNENGGLTVLGAFLKEDPLLSLLNKENETLAPIFDNIELALATNGELPETIPFNQSIEIADLFKDYSGRFYNGSLTTPPFSENVNWFVFEEPIKISSEQMDIYQDFLESAGIEIEGNNRDLQPVNGRQFNELNHQIQVTSGDSITGLNFGNTPVNEIIGGQGDETLSGTAGFDRILGGMGEDELSGLEGNDTMHGGKGDDILNGGLGNDVLSGDLGDDTFVLVPGEGADTITDFGNGDDLISVLGLTFNDLSFAGNSILHKDTKEILATLTAVDTTTLGSSDFAIV